VALQEGDQPTQIRQASCESASFFQRLGSSGTHRAVGAASQQRSQRSIDILTQPAQ
jgi:hypothetical protein